MRLSKVKRKPIFFISSFHLSHARIDDNGRSRLKIATVHDFKRN